MSRTMADVACRPLCLMAIAVLFTIWTPMRHLRSGKVRRRSPKVVSESGGRVFLKELRGSRLRGGCAQVEEFDSKGTEEIFENIYETRMWGYEGDGSGLGSEPSYTIGTRRSLLSMLNRHNISSMIDAPCGALKWTQIMLRAYKRARGAKGFRYLGVDIVKSLIEENVETFRGSDPEWEFKHADIAEKAFPDGYDLIFTRDALQHLPLNQVWKILHNVAKSSSRYWIVGSYDGDDNRQINPGDLYNINLRAPPFNLDKPMEVVQEETPDGKLMLLYDVQNYLRPALAALETRNGNKTT